MPLALHDLLSNDEHAACEVLRERLGVDVLATYQFWEHIVARALTGVVTPPNCPHDVDVDGWRIEVKVATEHSMTFTAGGRRVFRWADRSGLARDCDALVLIGVDKDRDVSLWVVPGGTALGPAATIVVPAARRGHSTGPLPGSVPLDQLLPEVLRACHLSQELAAADAV